MAKRERKKSAARRAAEKRQEGFGRTSLKVPKGAQFLKVEEGVKRLNVIPYEAGPGNPNCDEGELYFERTFYTHRIGPNNDAYVCPAKTVGKKCPVCEAAQKLRSSDDADDEELKALKPKERQLFNVVDLKEPEKGVQLLEFSYHCFGRQLNEEILADEDGEDGVDAFYMPDETGMTLKVAFKKQSGGGYSFLEATSINFKPRAPLDEETVAAAHNLDSLIEVLPYDKLKAIFLQESDDDGDDDDDTPAPPKGKGKRPAPADDEDDDEDEDDADNGDDDDEDDAPPPKAAKPKTKPKPAPAEDDEEDDDDDDDDEPAPPPKAKGKGDKPKAKPAPADDDDDDEDDDEPAPAPKAKTSGKRDKAKGKGKAADDENWENWDDDEDE